MVSVDIVATAEHAEELRMSSPAIADGSPAAASSASIDTASVSESGQCIDDAFDQVYSSQPPGPESSQPLAVQQEPTQVDLTHPSPSDVPPVIDLDP